MPNAAFQILSLSAGIFEENASGSSLPVRLSVSPRLKIVPFFFCINLSSSR